MPVHILTVKDLADFGKQIEYSVWQTRDEAFAHGAEVVGSVVTEEYGEDCYEVSVDTMDVQTSAVYGDEAYAMLTGDEQEELFAMLVDEAADRSSRDIAREMIDGMDLAEMREYLEYSAE